MKVKTSELTGAALDGVVNQIEECCDDPNTPMFSTSWAQGGPIIEREKIATRYDHDEQEWQATFPDMDGWVYGWGTTPLIAAMRCYVASKLGDNIELPEELK